MPRKTFKGMTDETLAWQTERFRELQVSDDGWVVTVRPEQVVEIAFDGVQRSSRYPGGVALSFARVLRYRDDKPAAEADTIETLHSYVNHAGQLAGVLLSEIQKTLDVVRTAGIRHWVGGGWGVDALVGRQTRDHRDLDLAVDEEHLHDLRLLRQPPSLH